MSTTTVLGPGHSLHSWLSDLDACAIPLIDASSHAAFASAAAASVQCLPVYYLAYYLRLPHRDENLSKVILVLM